MPDLLLELFSEEIPARMQRRAADDLKALITDGLVAAGLTYEGAVATATPRRLALHLTGIPGHAPDRTEERKGPRVGAPDGAIQGFLKAAGLASLDEAAVVDDGKKGSFYVARRTVAGRAAPEVLADLIPETIRRFPWPKSMRWGTGSLRWVRPLHSIVATFGTELEEPELIPVSLEGVTSGTVTRGHRFLSEGEIRVKRWDDYVPALERAKVVVDMDRRKDIIRHDAKDRALALGLDLVEDEGLLEEVAGLVEWPVVLVGAFEPEFLELPDEVIRLTIRINQKCFVLKDPATGRLANRFVPVSNLEASDGGLAIVAGNERVVRARLSDARFFYATDLKHPLADRLPKLDAIIFQEKLGTQGARVTRIAALAHWIAPLVGAAPEKAERAARLAKTDLVTEMVGEFPELQGYMGRRYAEVQGEDAHVAAAIEEHYKPQGPNDRVPEHPVSVAVALADKLDTLVGFWSIDEKPTGSKDPYALRRAALGVIRLILTNNKRVALTPLLTDIFRMHADSHVVSPAMATWFASNPTETGTLTSFPEIGDLFSFLIDRLKVQLREQGARHDLVDAVFALPGQDDLVLMVKRIEALGSFLATDDGATLLSGYRRAANILKAEEKKAGHGFDAPVDPALLAETEEKALADAIARVHDAVVRALSVEQFQSAMVEMATLRAPVDAFFDKILVNVDDAALRANRLALLSAIRTTTLLVADFGRIAG